MPINVSMNQSHLRQHQETNSPTRPHQIEDSYISFIIALLMFYNELSLDSGF
jgi:hypothetical protein